MNDNPKYGYYEEVDNHGVHHRIAKHIDPEIDGTCLVRERPVIYDLENLPEKMSVEEFDELIESSVPKDVIRQIDAVVVEGNKLARQSKADVVTEENQLRWRRGMVLSWVHSRDIETVMAAIGHPKDTETQHDMLEFAKAKHIKKRLGSADKWYKDLVLAMNDDEDVNVGFFNANFSGSMFNWGLNKMGTQNAMDAHRLSDHHIGTPEHPLNIAEKAVNFVIHHLPREHFGIRHEPRGDWKNLEEVMAVDHSTYNNPLLRLIARDAAKMIQLLEEEGKIVPWQLLAPEFKNSIPRNVKLKFQGSTTLRQIAIRGGITYLSLIHI